MQHFSHIRIASSSVKRNLPLILTRRLRRSIASAGRGQQRMTMTTEIPTQIELQRRNYRHIRELIRVSFAIGVNLTSSSCFKDSLRIINVLLIVSSIASLYGNWSQILRYLDDIPKMAESIATILQTMISVAKMIYFLYTQRRFYHLLRRAQRHELLVQSQLYAADFPIMYQLRREIDDIMKGTWRNIRGQLLFYIFCCSAIVCNYFFGALFRNLYHQLNQTPNYQHMLPFCGYWPIWEDKGMSFPYYHIQMLLAGIADYIAGMAVSFDGVFIVLCRHSVGLIESLQQAVLQATSPLVPSGQRVAYLRLCIKLHQEIDEYVQELWTIYRHISLSQFLCSMVVFGIVMFQMSIGLESNTSIVLRMVMYISAAGYEIFCYCFNGERLTTAYNKLPMAYYSCEWYNESQEFKQLILMMIMRTNRPFHFDISWFAPMSMETLMAMVRASGSYFLLLRNVIEED